MTILLVGCGRMGSALARGWAGRRRVLVLDPMARDLPEGTERIPTLDGIEAADELTVVLAVKPQVFGSVAQDLRALAARDALFVSIMAGITLGGLSDALGSTRVIRAMPNTPAAIGRGITAAVTARDCRTDDVATADALLFPTGPVVWLDDEDQIDAVTALSGSGPAYYFRFTEALAAAGAAAGLPAGLAMQLARTTFTGAAALAEADLTPLAELRRQVTSPAGTTAAGLAAMEAENAIDRLACAIIDSAAERSRQLAG
ncbi:MAG: pyrroline-5-carboxylate reductase [Novosphingobium sp.]